MWSTASAPEEQRRNWWNEASGIRTRIIRATAGHSCRLSYSPSVIRRRSNAVAGAPSGGSRVPSARAPCRADRREIQCAAWYCFRFQTITCQSASGARSADTTSVNALVAQRKTPHLAQGAGGAFVSLPVEMTVALYGVRLRLSAPAQVVSMAVCCFESREPLSLRRGNGYEPSSTPRWRAIPLAPS